MNRFIIHPAAEESGELNVKICKKAKAYFLLGK